MGFLLVSVMGTFLHFLYELTGKAIAAALVSAVNESIWEHMKLIFYPMMLYALLVHCRIKEGKAELRFRTLAGIFLALILIPSLYYTYTGILGFSVDWFNITIFFLAAGAAYYLEYRIESACRVCRISSLLWLVILFLLAGIFTVATFFPPRIPLFRDPLTGTYGIWAVR